MRKLLIIVLSFGIILMPFAGVFQVEAATPSASAQESLEDPSDWETVTEGIGDWEQPTLDDTAIQKNEPTLAAVAKIDELGNNANEYAALFDETNQNKIVLSEQDIDAVREGKIDERLLQTLIYLVKPVSEKGAGFERIKVKRLIKNYATEKKALSKESEYDNENEINVSAHFDGQAVDISEVDYIHFKKKTSKKALGVTYSSKTEDLASIPINIAWQSDQAKAETIPGFYGDTANELFNNLESEKVKDIFGDYIDYNLDRLKGNDIPEWAKWIGVIALIEDYDFPKDSFGEGNDLNEHIKDIGRSTIAEKLKIDKSAVYGETREELIYNIGRSTVEKKLNLDQGSLKGDNFSEIFKNAGKRKLEKQLKLKPGMLDGDPKIAFRKIKSSSTWQTYSGNEAKDEAFDAPDGSAEAIEKDDEKGLMLIGAGTILYALSAKNKNEIINKVKQGQPLDVDIKIEKADLHTDVDFETLKSVGAKDKEARNNALKDTGAKTLDAVSINPDLSLGMSKKDFDKIKKGDMKMNDLVVTVGSRQMENNFGLPENAIYYNMRQTVLSKENGQQIVEQKLGLKKGSFYGTFEDVLNRNPDNGAEVFINSYSVDAGFNLAAGTTDKLLRQEISADDYSKMVSVSNKTGDFIQNIGRAAMEEQGKNPAGASKDELSNAGRQTINKKVVKELNKHYKLTDKYAKYEITEDDAVALLSGNWQTPASKIASRTLDKTLSLPENGTMDMVLGKKPPEQVFQEAGAIRFGKTMGLRNPVSVEGDLHKNYGQSMIEEKLGLTPGSFSGDIDEIIWGKNSGKSTLFFENNKDTDALLGIPQGSTEKLTGKRISTDDYCRLVANRGITDLGLQTFADRLGIEGEYGVSSEEFSQAVTTILNWKDAKPEQKAGFFSVLSKATGRSFDAQFEFEPDITRQIAENPDTPTSAQKNPKSVKDRAVVTIQTQGMRKLNKKIFGIDQDIFVMRYREGKGLDFIISGTALQDWATPKIMNVTNIPNTQDASLFLNGNIKDGFVCWSVANLTKETNDIFDKWGMPSAKFTYDEAKAVYFGDPATEQQAMDEVWNKYKTDHPDAPESLKESMQGDARAFYRNEAKKNLQYKVMDSYFIDKADDKIPLGFSKTMFEGTWQERTSMIASYEVARATKGLVSMSPEDATLLRQGKFGQMSDAFYSSFENYLNMGEKMGFVTQPGTIKSLFQIAQGGATSAAGWDNLGKIYTDWGTQKVFNFFDKQLGAPVGTAYQIYQSYDAYNKANDAYQTAKTLNDFANLRNSADIATTTKNLNESSKNLNDIKMVGINFVVQLIGAKTFSKWDQQLGAPPGTCSGLVTLLLTGNPIGLIFAFAMKYVFTIKVEVMGEIPICQQAGSTYNDPTAEKMPQQSFSGIFSKLGFGGSSAPGGYQKITGDPQKDFPFYQAHAQCAVKRLSGALLNIGNATGNKDLLPTQILTLRPEDVQYFASEVETDYGKTEAERGLSGMLYSDMFSEYVHIGY